MGIFRKPRLCWIIIRGWPDIRLSGFVILIEAAGQIDLLKNELKKVVQNSEIQEKKMETRFEQLVHLLQNHQGASESTDPSKSPSAQISGTSYSSSRSLSQNHWESPAMVSSCPKFVSVHNEEENSHDGFRFRMVSYNILAEEYYIKYSLPRSPLLPRLRWDTHSTAILTVLKSLESDFLCIQELDEYDTFYKPNIESDGYSSIYIPRSGEQLIDGCGIFYKLNSAELVLEERIEYNNLAEGLPPKNGPIDPEDLDDPHVRLKRNCVGIMAAFRLKDRSHHHLIVANTHIYWDPQLADVKLAQAKYLLSRLNQFKATVSAKFDCNPSVVVCGDFNSVPRDKVYEYLTSGHSATTLAQGNSQELPIPLCSTYAFAGGEPPFTNCTPTFTNTLDYIFFSPTGRIKPVSLLEIPGLKSSSVVGGLPNYHHPSDHLPIGADFEVART